MEKVNLKVKMTKKLLANALLELYGEGKAISVKTVCERAGVHRSTFYLHYKGTEQLLEEIGGDFLEQVVPLFDSAKTLKELNAVLVNYLRFVRKNPQMFRVLVIEKQCEAFLGRFMEWVYVRFPDWFKNSVPEEKRRYIISYVMTGCIGIQASWIENNFDLSETELADTIYKLTTLCCGGK